MKYLKTFLMTTIMMSSLMAWAGGIDRKAVVSRNNPQVNSIDSLGALSVGNGSFATTVDITGLQSFPDFYRRGISLCAQSDWGWHSAPNVKDYKMEETLGNVDPGNGIKGLYAMQFKTKGSRGAGATEYFRVNPHRLNLGTVGLDITDSNGHKVDIRQLSDIRQSLDMWDGVISSHFTTSGKSVDVTTTCHPQKSCLAAKISSPLLNNGQVSILFRYSYPSMGHVDDGNNWKAINKHTTKIIQQGNNFAVLERKLDATTYYVRISWEGNASFREVARHQYKLSAKSDNIAFTCEYSEKPVETSDHFGDILTMATANMNKYWNKGAIIDFSDCRDARAKEVERRVVLSQYLTAIQCRGNMPPQESGLTLNTWYGRPHLEMAWWHLMDFALFGHIDVLEKAMEWYDGPAYAEAKKIATRQGLGGIRWMKMTDPWAGEAPSNVGSFLLWQQPHYIYFAEEIYRNTNDKKTLEKYGKQVDETAQMMADYVTYDKAKKCYTITGATAMQETMQHDKVYNPPFELAYWRYGLSVAQTWRERQGLPRVKKWDDIINNLAQLPERDGVYIAAAKIGQITEDYLTHCHSDHPAVLAACGMLPRQPLYDNDKMVKTYQWVMKNWTFDTMWGWDFGVLAMTAARLGEQNEAVNALVMKAQKNTYLNNGHNFQNERLKLYLPGNGAILEAVAMMCAGWDGCPNIQNPGFPQDGNWNVKWEGLKKMQ